MMIFCYRIKAVSYISTWKASLYHTGEIECKKGIEPESGSTDIQLSTRSPFLLKVATV